MFYGKEKKGRKNSLLLFVQTPFTLCITLCTKRYLLINDLIACMHVRLSVLNILILIEFRCIDFFFDGNEIFKKVNIIKTLLPIGYTKLSPLIDRCPFGGP